MRLNLQTNQDFFEEEDGPGYWSQDYIQVEYNYFTGEMNQSLLERSKNSEIFGEDKLFILHFADTVMKFCRSNNADSNG